MPRRPPSPIAESTQGMPLRERILNAAFTTFVERGYTGTSTLEIATRAKVSKRELYAEFGSKQAVLKAGIEMTAQRMRQPLELPSVGDQRALKAVLIRFGEGFL